MSLKNKAAKIDLGNLDDAAADPSPEERPSPPATGRRSGVAAISQSIAAHHRVQDLEAEVAQLRSAAVVVKLDPAIVREGRWKNRQSQSFTTQSFLNLKNEIAEAGGNVQPIKVRPVDPQVGVFKFEIVYGRRRLRACLDLGLPVNAVVESLDDMSVFIEADRENRNRADLSAWEQGLMYKDALDAGLFPSQRQMAAKLGVQQSNLAVAVKLASLPDQVIAAFRTPLDLQFRWAQPLTEALQKDPVRVTSVAVEIANRSVRPPSKEVLALLTLPADEGVRSQDREFSVDGKVLGTLILDGKGGATLKLKRGVLTAAREKKLAEFVEKLLA